jgi:penicillin-binding protein 1B
MLFKRKPSRKKVTRKKKTVRKKARATKSSRSKMKRSTKRQAGLLRRWWRGLLAVGLLGLLLTFAYSIHLSQSVRVAFDGKRWSIPARVFARPLELYVGAQISDEQLRYELGLLGYRAVSKVSDNAQWSESNGVYQIASRAFEFWDGPQWGQKLRVVLQNDQVVELDDAGTRQSLDIVRLEAPSIGSIYPAHREDRILVRRSEIPDHLVAALLAVEDRRFYEHWGIDPRGLARAMFNNLRAGRVVQGGSTLTQQLVKNFLLSSERSITRKVNEALMAFIVESRYSKDEILEAYVNEIFLGQDRERSIHGFGLAAQFYFNRPLHELRLHETALLVGMVKGASYYNPRRNPVRAKTRRNVVLTAMADQRYITQAQAERAKKAPLGVTQQGKVKDHRYPAFIQMVRDQLRRDYHDEDLTSEGLRIFTTLDPWAQRQASVSANEQLSLIESKRKIKKGTLEMAMVMVSPQGGEVRALLGSRNPSSAGFNRALLAQRPIGSLVKPAVYLAALAQPDRYSLTTLLNDKAVDIKMPNGSRWQPKNYDKKEYGNVPLYQGLMRSLNLSTVDLGLSVGLENVVEMVEKLGITEGKAQPYPSLLLGAVSLSPVEVAQMYQTISAGGYRAPLRAIREVLDAKNQPLQRYGLEVTQVVDNKPVFVLESAMKQVVDQGTARGLKRYLGENPNLAGKTGTTDDLRDSWYAGFGGDHVAVVWVGRDDNKPTGLTGSSGALPIYGQTLRRLGYSPLIQEPPSGVNYEWVDESADLLAGPNCSESMRLPFIQGSEPKRSRACAGGGSSRAGLLDRLFN